MTSIGEFAFYQCSRLTSVTIGNNVESIGDGAFSRCNSLIIRSLAKIPPILESTIDAISLEVPLGSAIEYTKAKFWNDINNIFAKSNNNVYYPLFFVENGEHVVSISEVVGDGIEVVSNQKIRITKDGNQTPYGLIMVGDHDASETIINGGKYEFYPSISYKNNIIRT